MEKQKDVYKRQMCYISIASGGTEHNRAAVHLAFDGGEAPDGMPADYQAYVCLLYTSSVTRHLYRRIM